MLEWSMMRPVNDVEMSTIICHERRPAVIVSPAAYRNAVKLPEVPLAHGDRADHHFTQMIQPGEVKPTILVKQLVAHPVGGCPCRSP